MACEGCTLMSWGVEDGAHVTQSMGKECAKVFEISDFFFCFDREKVVCDLKSGINIDSNVNKEM